MLGGLFGKKDRKQDKQTKTKEASKQNKQASAQKSRAQKASGAAPTKSRSASSQGKPANKQNSAKGQGDQAKTNRKAPAKESPSKSAWTIDQYQVAPAEGKTRFHDLNLELSLLHAIADLNYEYCSEIQAESLPHTLKGHDVIGKAQTGTGKTAAFLITIINDLLKRPVPAEERYASEPRALILAPTRELALQIEKDARALTKHVDLSIYGVVGGIDYQRQKDYVHNQILDILVATPGRLIDFLQSGDIYLDQLDFLVIDEADRMLDMGFIPDVKRILSRCPKVDRRQTLLFSATFNQDVMNLANRWTSYPINIEIEAEQLTTERVEQKIFMVPADEKLEIICRYIELNKVKKAIIFGNRRDETRRLESTLKQKGVKAALLSGEVPQHKRIKTLDQFKGGQIEILVATDVAGRGIHVDGVSHVFNYNLPEDAEDYVHRIGRTGRAGETGVSISFACEDDAFLLPELEAYIGMKLNCEYPDYLLDANNVQSETKQSEPKKSEAKKPEPKTAKNEQQAQTKDSVKLAESNQDDKGNLASNSEPGANADPEQKLDSGQKLDSESGAASAVQTEPQTEQKPAEGDSSKAE